jgi:hypothetical protein
VRKIICVFLFTAALLAGCSTAIHKDYVVWGEGVCEPHGGLVYVWKDGSATTHFKAVCRDGTEVVPPYSVRKLIVEGEWLEKK